MIKNSDNTETSKIFSSIITLISGSLFAQVIIVVASPLMTRLYDAESIGSFTFILSAVSIFAPVINGKYELALITEHKENTINALIKLSIYLGLALSCVITIVYFFYFEFYTNYSHSIFNCLSIFILLILANFQNVLTSLNNKDKNYKLITSTYVLRTSVQNVVMIILGLFKPSFYGLLSSQIIGQFFGTKKQAISLRGKSKDITQVTFKQMFDAALKYKNQLIFSTPAAFANAFSYSSINLFIQNLYGLDTLGYYSISYRVLGLPLNLISGNVSKVYYEVATREKRESGNYFRITIKLLIILMTIAVLLFFSMSYIVPSVIELIFGKEWKVSGEYVKILSPMFSIRFITSSLSTATTISNKQNIDFVLQTLFIISSVVSFVLCKVYNLNTQVFLMMITYTYTIIYILYLIYIIKCSKNRS